MNTNGILSFLQFTGFIPQRFPLSIPLIAPFWHFVGFRRSGNIFFRQTSNATLLQRARDQLQLFPSSGNFTPTTMFIATWDKVAQFGGELQVSAYTVTILLGGLRVSDIMSHYTWSAMENCFIIDVLCIRCTKGFYGVWDLYPECS